MRNLVEKVCETCGKTYNAYSKRQRCCCKHCTNELLYKENKEKRKCISSEELERRRKYQREKYRRKRQPKGCIECGTPLPTNVQTFCITCLLKGFAKGDDYLYSHRLHSRGYTDKMIWEEIAERNIQVV